MPKTTFCTELVADPQTDELVRLKQRITALEAELRKAKQASSGGIFGSFELLPNLASGKLPESKAERLSQAKVPDMETAGVHQVIWINAKDGNVRTLMPIPDVVWLKGR